MGLFPAYLRLGLRILLNTALQAAEPWCPGKEAPPSFYFIFLCTESKPGLALPRLFVPVAHFSRSIYSL